MASALTPLAGQVAVVTGAGRGIGAAIARELARRGAQTVLCGRTPARLIETANTIAQDGNHAEVVECDVTLLASVEALARTITEKFGRVDILVNNAGIGGFGAPLHQLAPDAWDRILDTNLRGVFYAIRAFAPAMIRARSGHIINISSIGVLSNAPRFSAYVASKSALDSFAACAASEFIDKGVDFTTINMPLVRTPMIAPTRMYESVPTLSPEEAADLVVEAIVYKPVRIATRLGIFGAVSHAIAPKLTQILLNTAFNMFPDSAAAAGRKEGAAQPLSAEQMAFAQLTQGIHW